MATSPSIVWLRDDLRIADNPALTAAVERGGAVVVLYLLDEQSPGARPLGGASRWWLHGSLTALATELADRGAQLALRSGAAGTVIPALVDEIGAGAVYWNRRYGALREVDAALKQRLRADGPVRGHAAQQQDRAEQQGNVGAHGAHHPARVTDFGRGARSEA